MTQKAEVDSTLICSQRSLQAHSGRLQSQYGHSLSHCEFGGCFCSPRRSQATQKQCTYLGQRGAFAPASNDAERQGAEIEATRPDICDALKFMQGARQEGSKTIHRSTCFLPRRRIRPWLLPLLAYSSAVPPSSSSLDRPSLLMTTIPTPIVSTSGASVAGSHSPSA